MSKEIIVETWTGREFGLEFSNPSVQGFAGDFEPIGDDGPKGILYFNYDVALYRKKPSFVLRNASKNEEKETYGFKWKKVLSTNVRTFPALFAFKEILERARSASRDDSWQKIPGTDGDEAWTIFEDTLGVVSEDYYGIRKTETSWIEPSYRLFVGRGFDAQGDVAVKSASFPVTGNDVDEIVAMLERFVARAIERHDFEAAVMRKKASDALSAFGGALHVDKLDFERDEEDELKGVSLERIMHAGDKLELSVVRNDRQFEVRGVMVEARDGELELSDATITRNGGSIRETVERLTIPFSDVAYVAEDTFSTEAGNPRLNDGIEKVEADFLASLNEAERAEIVALDEDEAVRRYVNPLINFAWLMRNEHDLPKIDFDERLLDRWSPEQANAYANAENALRRIRKKIAERDS